MEHPYSQGEDFCPAYHHAVELIGRRWTGVILRQLLLGSSRFAEIRDAIPALTDRMLASRLRELEAESIVTRTVIDTIPVQVQYELTDKGRDLERTITALSEWADHWEGDRGESPTAS
ncbi:HxlR family transcriptional regulator [Tamaricihabitans halophyticus]|uniref:HxlR family transcriptional regulator n=1 Tax=Tamaricihabitans halophyticus TaxID=1262583 RepID=A0A4R2QBA0_9PSEU|nr:helix-turn-helix domain-containing protein [Tamaricihabitans halophyticus]TCP45819.1 HxlR family transcriptional regulator [Tamaricihabitans halophyticus]